MQGEEWVINNIDHLAIVNKNMRGKINKSGPLTRFYTNKRETLFLGLNFNYLGTVKRPKKKISYAVYKSIISQ